MAGYSFARVPTLETPRLRLRQITERDCAAWLAVIESPGALRYLLDFPSPPRLADMQAIFAWAERIFREKSGIRWAITLKPAHTMIGSCGFHLYAPCHRRAEVGYELHSGYWRRGIMTEALAAVLRFCFEQLDLHRVEADVVEGNIASAALLKKMGFTLEGAWRDREYQRGAYHSLWQFGLLQPEFRAKQFSGLTK